MTTASFSVIIPLYNKEQEIGNTLRSVLAQTLPPAEIVIVDDGSTDHSAQIVQQISSPLVKLITQTNAGVCAARNRAVAESTGEYLALLDADDEWEPTHLADLASLIAEHPACGLYATAFRVADGHGLHLAPCPEKRGIVADFFGDSAHRYIAIPSAVAIPREVYKAVGGFPEGMKIAEDLYVWIKIAREYRVAFSPVPSVRYSKVASNRSASSYTPEKTRFSFEELYNPSASESEREFIARAALGKALIISAKGGTEEAARAIRTFAYTRVYRRTLRKVRLLNRLPVSWRTPLLNVYNRLAWLIAKKGL